MFKNIAFVLFVAALFFNCDVAAEEEKIKDINEELYQALRKCEFEKLSCNDVETKYKYGLSLVVGNLNRTKGLGVLASLADAGHIDAMFFLAQELRNKEFTSYDLEKSYQYSKKVIKQLEQIEISQWKDIYFGNLATMYFYGNGIAKNYAKAFFYATEGANRGNNRSMVLLMYMYAKGLGVETNKEKAQNIYEKLKKSGYVNNLKRSI